MVVGWGCGTARKVGFAAAMAAGLLLPAESRADCVREGTVVTCASPSPNGYDETVYDGRTDRTVNISADVADGVEINLTNGGNIVIDQTAGTITNNYGEGVYLKTSDGKISGTVGNINTRYNGLDLVAPEIDVTVTGSISGTGRGFAGVLLYDVGTVKLTNAGGADNAITGNETGISVWTATDLTFDNKDGSRVVSTRGTGLFAYDISGDVHISNDGSTIQGVDDGFGAWDVVGDVTVTNGSGTISGGMYGVDIWTAGGDVTVSNGSGSISGTTDEGVYIAEVQGDVKISNGAGGEMTSAGSYGVLAYLVEGDTTVENSGGLIRGKSTALYADGARVLVSNQGAIGDDEEYHYGLITGGDGGASPVVTIVSESYSAETDEGGATLRNGAGGLIVSDAVTEIGETADPEEIAAAAEDVAVKASGGRIFIGNQGTIVGRVQLTDEADTLENNGIWLVGGVNDFGGGEDRLSNKGDGVIQVAHSGLAAETTRFDALESLANEGTFSLADGGAGDTASVTGDMSFGSSSIYAVDLNLAGQADLTSVSGTATIEDGAKIAVTGIDGITLGTDYRVLTAKGGITGNFLTTSEIAPLSGFLGLTSTNTGNDIYVRLGQTRSFLDAARTRNQRAVAGALPLSGPLYEALLMLPDDASAQRAFSQLAGDFSASLQGVFITESRLVRETVLDRLRAADRPEEPGPMLLGTIEPEGASARGLALWASGYGAWSDVDGTVNAAELSSDAGGLLIGADAVFGAGWRLGLFGGYGHSNVDGDNGLASASSDDLTIGAYSGNRWGRVALRSGLAYSWKDIEAKRSVAFPGFADRLEADYDAGVFQSFSEVGYAMETPFAAFEPFAGLAYVSFDGGAFSESGGAAALASSGGSTDTTFSTLGGRLAREVIIRQRSATLHGTLAWQHAFGDVTPEMTQSFAGSAPFTVIGTPIAEDAALVGAGLGLDLGPNATLDLDYTGQFGDGTTQSSFDAAVKIGF